MTTLKHLLALACLTLCACSAKKSDAPKETTPAVQVLNDRIVGVAEIQPQQKVIALYPQTGGIVKAIYHDINGHVTKGDVIAELVSDLEQAQLQQAQSKLVTQQAVIESSKAQLASLHVKSNNALANYTRNQNLIQSGAVTQQALDDSKFSYDASTKDVEASRAVAHQQQDKLNELRADVHYYEQLIRQKKITAPFDGKVLAIDGKIGNYINTTQSLGDFAPDGKLMAITEVDELFADKIHEGIPAYIRAQGQTDTLATGKIYLTAPYLRKKSLFSNNAANMEDRRVREVRVLLDDPARVLIGSRVECVFVLPKN